MAINAFLVHLSMNMWEDCTPAWFNTKTAEDWKGQRLNWQRMPMYYRQRAWSDHRRFDTALWHEYVKSLAAAGVNFIFFDLADGYKWQSHSELALPEAWTPEEMRAELDFCRSWGIEVAPKINFSSTHDAWMRDYSRALSTPWYYQLAKDLIKEAFELFDAPRHFHLGMDEEEPSMQADYLHVSIRQGELWWHDFNFFCDEVRKLGATPWMWADKAWHCGIEEFVKHVPQDVIQCNWYYTPSFENRNDFDNTIVDTFLALDKYGYKQVATGSNWLGIENYPNLVKFCKENIKAENLLGFMNAPWYSIEECHREVLNEAVEQIKMANIQ